MIKIKKIMALGIFTTMILSLQGCDPKDFFDFFEELFSPNVEVIRGTKTISGDGNVFTIQPGTTVRFKETTFGNVWGELVITNGAKLIAQGTAEEPIIFESPDIGGQITLKETASNESIIEYCELNSSTRVDVWNSTVTIQYNKFNTSSISLCKNSSPIILYNTFDGQSELIQLIWGGAYAGSAIIKYNIIKSALSHGIQLHTGGLYGNKRPILEYNNIEDCEDYAVWWWNEDDENDKLSISNNYIANCNSKTGVDTTGEQSDNVIYETYRTTPVEEAGCGW